MLYYKIILYFLLISLFFSKIQLLIHLVKFILYLYYLFAIYKFF